MKNIEGIDFTRVIIDGVELKSCKLSHQSYKKHLHHELSLGIIREGKTTVDFGTSKFTFAKGDGVIIPSRMSHLCSPEDVEDWRFDMLYIDQEMFADKLEFLKVVKLSGKHVDKVDEFIQLLDIEQNPEVIEEKMIDLLIVLEEETQGVARITTEQEKFSGLDIKEFIESKYDSKINLDELQRSFNTNKYALIRIFKKEYNTTPIAYQLQLKVAEAKRCLAKGMDVFDICNNIGFYDQAHFIREFHKMNGLTPNAYIKKLNDRK